MEVALALPRCHIAAGLVATLTAPKKLLIVSQESVVVTFTVAEIVLTAAVQETRYPALQMK